MTEGFSRPGQIVVVIIFLVKTADLNERKPSTQYSPHCVSVVMIFGMDCSAEALLKNSFRKLTQMQMEELTKLFQKRLNSFYGREVYAVRIHQFRNQREEKCFVGTRLLYYMRRLLESRPFEKKYAAWYREGPPNSLFCRSESVIT